MAYLCFARGQYVSANALSASARPDSALLLGAFLIFYLGCAHVYWLRVRADLFIRRAKQFLYLPQPARERREAKRGFTAASVAAISLFAKSCCAATDIQAPDAFLSACSSALFVCWFRRAPYLIGLEGLTESLLTLLRLLLCILVYARVCNVVGCVVALVNILFTDARLIYCGKEAGCCLLPRHLPSLNMFIGFIQNSNTANYSCFKEFWFKMT